MASSADYSRLKNTPTGYVGGARGGQDLTSQAYPKSSSNWEVNNGTMAGSGNASSTSYNPYANMSQEEYNARILHQAPSTGSGSSPAASKSSGSGSGSGSGSANNSAYINSLLAQLGSYNNSNYYDQMKAAAQNAYNNGMNALNSAYGAQMDALNSNLSSTKNQLLKSYNNSKQDIQDDATNSLKQAYINKMLSQRNLGQQMSAQGLNGGATETTLASMQNNYGNARNNINTTTNKNLTNLENNYQNNLAEALQAYNSAVAQANLAKAQQQMQLESALANNQISALGSYQDLMQAQNSDYISLLKSLISNSKNFTFDPTMATNLYNAVGLTQSTPQNAATNYATLMAMQNGASQSAQPTTNALANGVNTNANANYLSALLQSLS